MKMKFINKISHQRSFLLQKNPLCLLTLKSYSINDMYVKKIEFIVSFKGPGNRFSLKVQPGEILCESPSINSKIGPLVESCIIFIFVAFT